MADSDYAEFSIAHDRLYTLDHLWMQVLDEDKEEGTTSIKIGLSEFLMAEFGEVIQIVLARPRDDSDFEIDAIQDSQRMMMRKISHQSQIQWGLG